MKNYIASIILLLICAQITAQTDTLNQRGGPIGGINNLALSYYGIEFTKDQRKYLRDKEIEFIYLVDKNGNPTLSEVNGLTDPIIINRLKQQEITKFNPTIRDGSPVESIYSMKLTYPTYGSNQTRYGRIQAQAYNEAKLEDFEYLEKSNARVDLIIGGMANQFIGNPTEFLKLGSGFKTEVSLTTKKNLIFGLDMNFYFNNRKKDYPINSNRIQIKPTTALVGAVVGKWFDKFAIQAEINFAIQNISEKLSENDEDFQLNGWSPGILINYPLKFGKEKPSYHYGSPNLLGHALNLNFGIRYIKLSLKEASGVMAELGVSYRGTFYAVKNYKLKDSFLNKMNEM